MRQRVMTIFLKEGDVNTIGLDLDVGLVTRPLPKQVQILRACAKAITDWVDEPVLENQPKGSK